jgi:hypothetical protein
LVQIGSTTVVIYGHHDFLGREKMRASKWLVSVVCSGFLAFAVAPAQAAGSSSDDEWQFSLMPYFWMSSVGLEAASGSEVDLSFGDLVTNLDVAFMGNGEVRKSKWSITADFIYMDVSASGGGTISLPTTEPLSPVVGVNADVDLQAWDLGFTGGYNLWQSERGMLDLIAGARYLALDVTLTAEAESSPPSELESDGRVPNGSDPTPPDPVRTTEVIKGSTVWDGVVGVKGDIRLVDRWYAPYYVDVGAGGSDFTWQIAVGVAYRFNWGELSALYRREAWDFQSGSPLEDLTMSGAMLGAKFRF